MSHTHRLRISLELGYFLTSSLNWHKINLRPARRVRHSRVRERHKNTPNISNTKHPHASYLSTNKHQHERPSSPDGGADEGQFSFKTFVWVMSPYSLYPEDGRQPRAEALQWQTHNNYTHTHTHTQWRGGGWMMKASLRCLSGQSPRSWRRRWDVRSDQASPSASPRQRCRDTQEGVSRLLAVSM